MAGHGRAQLRVHLRAPVLEHVLRQPHDLGDAAERGHRGVDPAGELDRVGAVVVAEVGDDDVGRERAGGGQLTGGAEEREVFRRVRVHLESLTPEARREGRHRAEQHGVADDRNPQRSDDRRGRRGGRRTRRTRGSRDEREQRERERHGGATARGCPRQRRSSDGRSHPPRSAAAS